jgi:hypothetical protein
MSALTTGRQKKIFDIELSGLVVKTQKNKKNKFSLLVGRGY